jgi:CheY-like chemotaxis protein
MNLMDRWVLAGKRILVADDDQSVREALRCLLSVDRHLVTEAADGCQALELFGKEHYDLVITDYAMPGIGGEELVQKIWGMAPDQPIIMATAHAEHLPIKTKNRGSILPKPFALNELRVAIARVMGLDIPLLLATP